jgi:hypothetical protein
MEKLSLKERMIIEDAVENRKRRDDLQYIEKKVKGEIERVTVELKGSESGVLTRLASRYDRLDKAIKVMTQKRNELNADIKEKVEDLFAAEDIVLTRVIDTVSFTMTVSKKSKVADKTTIDFEAIAAELAKLIPDELQTKVDEIVAAYTKITPQPDKSPALSVKAKVTEGMISDIASSIMNFVKKVIKSVTSWAPNFDKKLNKLKKQAEI